MADAPLAMRNFTAALDSGFDVRPCEGEGETVSVRLVEVTPRSAPPGYEQYSALFVGPASPVWPQGTYRFTHPRLGELELFMVPVGRAAAGVEYEVCVSRDAREDSA